jgi:signal peptidase complex subunit 1
MYFFFTGMANLMQLLALVLGAIFQDIHLSLYTGLAGTALAFLVVVPAWPFFNKHPVKWLPVAGSVPASGIEVDGKKIS